MSETTEKAHVNQPTQQTLICRQRTGISSFHYLKEVLCTEERTAREMDDQRGGNVDDDDEPVYA